MKSKIILIFLLGAWAFNVAQAQRSVSKSKITNDLETNVAEVNSSKELTTTDTPNLGGVDTVFNLTTTPVEFKVGASAKVNRKYILMQATSNNVKWGFNSSCNFDLKKNSFFMLPVGENTTVFLKASTGTATMVGGEI